MFRKLKKIKKMTKSLANSPFGATKDGKWLIRVNKFRGKVKYILAPGNGEESTRNTKDHECLEKLKEKLQELGYHENEIEWVYKK